ncbi:MAG: hypothetical protein ACRED9_04830 [Caulobacteraceae bacterium]
MTGFSVVFALYAHTIFNTPSKETTPVLAFVIAAGLVGLAVCGFASGRVQVPLTLGRELSCLLIALALGCFVLSTVASFGSRPMGINDWGLFAVEAGVPVLIYLADERGHLLRAVALACIIFALADAGGNVSTFLGWADLVGHAGVIGVGYGLHYLGYTGNSDAGGLVAFLAISWLAMATPRGWGARKWLSLAAMALIGFSLFLIGARRYQAFAAISVAILWVAPLGRLPLAALGIAIAGAFLAATFAAPYGDFDNNLRAELLQVGYAEAQTHPFVGIGPTYRDDTGLKATYDSLQGAGMTESGALDLAIQYGMPAAIFFLLAPLLALSGYRQAPTWCAVVLMCLTAEFAFGGTLTGFLGAVVFFTVLIMCQVDEITPQIRVFARERLLDPRRPYRGLNFVW